MAAMRSGTDCKTARKYVKTVEVELENTLLTSRDLTTYETYDNNFVITLPIGGGETWLILE